MPLKGPDDSKKIAGLLACAFAYHYGQACRVTATESANIYCVRQDVDILNLTPTTYKACLTPLGMAANGRSVMPSMLEVFAQRLLIPDYMVLTFAVTHLAWCMLYLRWCLVHAATSGLYAKEKAVPSFEVFFSPTELPDRLGDTGLPVPLVAQHLAQDLIQQESVKLGLGALPKDRIALAEHLLGKSDLKRDDFILAGIRLVKKPHADLAYSPLDVMGGEYYDSLLALVDYGCINTPAHPWLPIPSGGVLVAVDPHQCLSYIDHHA